MGGRAVLSPDGRRLVVTGSYKDGKKQPYWDMSAVAYDARTGSFQWATRYGDLPENQESDDAAMTPDGSTLIMTGNANHTEGFTLRYDALTVAFNASTGKAKWATRYDENLRNERLFAIALSPDGTKAFAVGASWEVVNGDNQNDWLVIAYDVKTGAQLWVDRYDGPGHGDDLALDVTAAADAVYVTGTSAGGPTDDFTTIAYDPATGAKLWTNALDGAGHGDDWAWAVGASLDGLRAYAAGFLNGRSGDDDLAVVAYDATTGKRLWVSRYDGPDNLGDTANSLVVSPDGTAVYAAGQSLRQIGGLQAVTVGLGATTGERKWVATYDGPNGSGAWFAYRALAMSPDGKALYAAGVTKSTGGPDIVTIAYKSSTGEPRWIEQYDPPVHPDTESLPGGVAVSRKGSTVYVTGQVDGGVEGIKVWHWDFLALSFAA